MKIHIIRHGDPNYVDDTLTEKGWREAKFLAERMSGLCIDDFYSSPLGRAKDTASLTLEKFGKKAEVLDWLREFHAPITSPFTNGPRIPWDLPPYLWCAEPKYYDINECFSTPLMESGNVKEEYERVTKGIDDLLLRYGFSREGMLYSGGEDKTIALFCHFGVGILILSYLLGISPVVAQHNFVFAPTSVTTLVTETDSKGFSHFRATEVGDTSHLYANGEPVSPSALHPNFEK